MKLIQILALASAVTGAVAQNTAGSTGKAGPSPTPAASAKQTPGKGAAATSPAGTTTKSNSGTPSTPASKGSTVKTASPNNASAKGSPATGAPGKGSTTSKTLAASGTAPGTAKTQPGATTKTGTVAAAPTAGKASVATGTLVKTARPADKRTAKETVTYSAAPGKGTTKVSAKASVSKPVMPPAKPAAPATPAAAAIAAAPEPEKKAPAKMIGANGRRDPFVSPIRAVGNVGPNPGCAGGKRCLSIPELILQGTVKDISGKMMAVVANSTRHTYTLRENDQVFNGSVEKITTDSIVFREFVKDALGRESAREVVKKMGPTS